MNIMDADLWDENVTGLKANISRKMPGRIDQSQRTKLHARGQYLGASPFAVGDDGHECSRAEWKKPW